ncbi:hypothetical protein KFK09_012175 [Dendrobium nobile]|uniref:Reverse transcriptase domain-containing protein n=1 Tax=Dendrobium nobile TaxID=94219 RepID=A0A8T3BI64_DENNO|nr:hypothetical protein KFK09_012175 [Dendrobium nobile]
MLQRERGLTKYFPISIGLHQGSALSPYLFSLVMDVLTRHLQEDVPWCMLFANDILLVDKTREGVEGKLELWRSTLESKSFRLSRSKTEYIECNFSSNKPSEGIVTLGDQVINKSTRFRYLGSIVQSDGEIDRDIISRIQVGWLKWRNASGLLCDGNVPLKLKGKFYKMVVRPAMLYGAKCWPLKEKHNTKLSVAEMRMLKWMSGFTLRDRIRNEHIREKVGVAPVEDKIRESRLRCFGHIKRRPSDDPVRRVEVLDLTYVKKVGTDLPSLGEDSDGFSRCRTRPGLWSCFFLRGTEPKLWGLEGSQSDGGYGIRLPAQSRKPDSWSLALVRISPPPFVRLPLPLPLPLAVSSVRTPRRNHLPFLALADSHSHAKTRSKLPLRLFCFSRAPEQEGSPSALLPWFTSPKLPWSLSSHDPAELKHDPLRLFLLLSALISDPTPKTTKAPFFSLFSPALAESLLLRPSLLDQDERIDPQPPPLQRFPNYRVSVEKWEN